MTPGLAGVARGVVLAGRYRIEDVVGQGGMATVYRAHDEVLDRDVAIKLFPPTPDGDEVLRHRSEMRVLARLSHPNLVMLHDAGSAYAGGPLEQTYLVMELVPGPTLADLVSTGPLSSAHVARVGRQLAEALVTVHEAGVVHRDIKPANVLLVQRERAVAEHPDAALTTGPIVKIADFGIARFSDSARLTMTGTTLGTATYLSPEQASGRPVGPPTDVYALGLVLLECLTGRKAFTGTVVEVAAARLTTDPVIPSSLGAAWCDLLVGMTRREPADRLSMAEVAVRLAELDGRPVGPAVSADVDTAAAPVVDVPTAAVAAVVGEPAPTDAAGARADGVRVAPVADVDVTDPTRRLRTAAVVAAARERARDAVERARAKVPPVEGAPPLAVDGTDGLAVRRGGPSRLTVALALTTAALLVVVAVLLTQLGSADDGTSPDYPTVDGRLGDALDELVTTVEP